MKKFSYYDYNKVCPLAYSIENAINDGGSAEKHIKKILEIFNGDEIEMSGFFTACIAYWAEAEHYDDRNEFAVLASKEIVKEFPDIVEKAELMDEDFLREAFGFTMSAHRYLQNELFNAIVRYDKMSEASRISPFLNAKEFVIHNGVMMPYKEYKAIRF